MKKIILTILLVSNLFSNDDLNNTALDMFLFKIGFNSLVGEMQNQKILTTNNRDLIYELQKQVATLSDMKKNNKISNNFNTPNSKNQTINNLQNKITLLEKKLNSVVNDKKLLNTIPNNDYQIARLILNKANVYKNKDDSSTVIYEIHRNEKLKIKTCDTFGWCELYNQKAYIAKYKLKFLN